MSNLKTRLVVKCPSCGSVMTKRRKKGKGAGIIYECPNSECPIIDVRIRYRHPEYLPLEDDELDMTEETSEARGFPSSAVMDSEDSEEEE